MIPRIPSAPHIAMHTEEDTVLLSRRMTIETICTDRAMVFLQMMSADRAEGFRLRHWMGACAGPEDECPGLGAEMDSEEVY